MVIGAGVSGLTTAIRLLEFGADVLVRTAAMPMGTTSAIAGAMIGPIFGDEDDPFVIYGRASLPAFRELAGLPGTGVRLRRGRLLAAPALGPGDPPWARTVPGYTTLSADDQPAGYVAGFGAELPFADMPLFLSWLLRRVGVLGGRVELRPVRSWADAESAVVVNCAGLGARELADDDSLVPVFGQHVVVDCPALTDFVYEGGGGDDWMSVMPHGRRVLLGGIARRGSWSVVPDPGVTEEILRRCVAAVPELRGAPVLGVEVGLRPGRRIPRVEVEQVGDVRVVHNYGHAGNGVMLSWGCAAAAAGLALA